MKFLPIFFIMMTLLISCEKSKDFQQVLQKEKFNDPVNTDFSTYILEGYWVTAMAFDQLGNAWIGTFSQGLIKYNAGEIVVYNQSNSGFNTETPINDIAVDSKNNVWIGCDALVKFDGVAFTFFNSSNSEIPEDYISSIAIDSKDNVWFASCRFREGGLVRYYGSDFKVFTPENSLLPVNLIHDIAIDANDKVWLGLIETVTETSLVRISGEEWNLFTAEDLGFSPYYIGGLGLTSDNKVVAAIDYSLSSAWFFNGPQVFVFDGHAAEQLKFDSGTRITGVTVDRSDHFWCMTYDGYAVYDGTQWFVDDTTFRDNSVFSIEQAPDHKLWMGTGDGIFIND